MAVMVRCAVLEGGDRVLLQGHGIGHRLLSQPLLGGFAAEDELGPSPLAVLPHGVRLVHGADEIHIPLGAGVGQILVVLDRLPPVDLLLVGPGHGQVDGGAPALIDAVGLLLAQVVEVLLPLGVVAGDGAEDVETGPCGTDSKAEGDGIHRGRR